MREHLAQSIGGALTTLALTVGSVLLPPTFLLLLLKMFVPAIGTPLWRAWGQLITWLIVTPIRLVRLLVREAFGRRHP